MAQVSINAIYHRPIGLSAFRPSKIFERAKTPFRGCLLERVDVRCHYCHDGMDVIVLQPRSKWRRKRRENVAEKRNCSTSSPLQGWISIWPYSTRWSTPPTSPDSYPGCSSGSSGASASSPRSSAASNWSPPFPRGRRAASP